MTKQTDIGDKQSKTRVRKKELQNKNIFELVEELDGKIAAMDEFNFDFELVKMYIDELQVREPIFVDMKKAFADFRRNLIRAGLLHVLLEGAHFIENIP